MPVYEQNVFVSKTYRFSPEMARDMREVVQGNLDRYPSEVAFVEIAISELIDRERAIAIEKKVKK